MLWSFFSRRAVPAIMHVPRPGEVVIHNHPSGRLVPSDADLSIASTLGNNGVGAYIVDERVTEVYVVVEPMRAPVREQLDRDAAVGLLAPGGAVGAALPGYEHRPQQLEMARAVRPGGSVVLVDFVRHAHEWMRQELGVAWLGFEPSEIAGWCAEAGLTGLRQEAYEGRSGARDLPATFIACARKPAV